MKRSPFDGEAPELHCQYDPGPDEWDFLAEQAAFERERMRLVYHAAAQNFGRQMNEIGRAVGAGIHQIIENIRPGIEQVTEAVKTIQAITDPESVGVPHYPCDHKPMCKIPVKYPTSKEITKERRKR